MQVALNSSFRIPLVTLLPQFEGLLDLRIVQTAHMVCTEGGSDKEYYLVHYCVTSRDTGFENHGVAARYGRRGSSTYQTANKGSMFSSQVANSEFTKIRREKLGKGYVTHAESGYVVRTGPDTFVLPVPEDNTTPTRTTSVQLPAKVERWMDI